MIVSAYGGNEKIVVDKSTLTRVAEEIPPASHRISSVPSYRQTQWPMCYYFHQRRKQRQGGEEGLC